MDSWLPQNEKLSSDQNELTITTSAKGRADQLSVWVRSGGVKVPANPFMGEWTQDLAKSRLRQGLIVKIDMDGKEQVRFSGEFNYTAAFDGKDYILANSNNDTVALVLVDAHTVESDLQKEAIKSLKEIAGLFLPMESR